MVMWMHLLTVRQKGVNAYPSLMRQQKTWASSSRRCWRWRCCSPAQGTPLGRMSWKLAARSPWATWRSSAAETSGSGRTVTRGRTKPPGGRGGGRGCPLGWGVWWVHSALMWVCWAVGWGAWRWLHDPRWSPRAELRMSRWQWFRDSRWQLLVSPACPGRSSLEQWWMSFPACFPENLYRQGKECALTNLSKEELLLSQGSCGP